MFPKWIGSLFMCFIGAGQCIEIHFHDPSNHCMTLKGGQFSFPSLEVGGVQQIHR